MPDVARLVTGLRQALSAHQGAPSEDRPLIIVDGYHGFGAIPTDLSAVAAECCYVGCASLPQGNSGGRTLEHQCVRRERAVLEGEQLPRSFCDPASCLFRADIGTILPRDACAAGLARKSGLAKHLLHDRASGGC